MTKGQGEYPDVVRVAIGWKLAVRCDSFVTWQEAEKKKRATSPHTLLSGGACMVLVGKKVRFKELTPL